MEATNGRLMIAVNRGEGSHVRTRANGSGPMERTTRRLRRKSGAPAEYGKVLPMHAE
jgi:hypothetical protein